MKFKLVKIFVINWTKISTKERTKQESKYIFDKIKVEGSRRGKKEKRKIQGMRHEMRMDTCAHE